MTEYAYIARQPCSAITGAVVDDEAKMRQELPDDPTGR